MNLRAVTFASMLLFAGSAQAQTPVCSYGATTTAGVISEIQVCVSTALVPGVITPTIVGGILTDIVHLMSLSNVLGSSTVPIASGGTNASTVAGAVVNLSALPHVANLTALKAWATSASPVVRDNYAATGDGGGATFTYSSTACSLASGAGDNGSQVKPNSGVGCWTMVVPVTGYTFESFGGDPSGVSLSDTPFVNWIVAQGAASTTGMVGTGRFNFANRSLFDTSVAEDMGIRITGRGCNATYFNYTGTSIPAFRMGQDKSPKLILGEISGGFGYTPGTYTNVALTGGAGTGATATFVVTNGAIGTLTLSNGGSLYTNGTYTKLPLTGGAGTGGYVDLVVSGGVITSATVNLRGYSYLVGNTLSVASGYLGGGGSGLSLTVATIGGAVTAMPTVSHGTGYLIGDALSVSNASLGGAGSGFSVTARGDNFYTSIKGIGFTGNVNGPLVQWGRNDMLDAMNGVMSDNCENNASVGAASSALRVNAVITSQYFSNVADAGGTQLAVPSLAGTAYAACDILGAAMVNFYGSCANAGIGIHVSASTSQYVFGNVFHAIDDEVTNKSLVVDNSAGFGAAVSKNTFTGGQWQAYTCTIDATAGNNNTIINGNLGSTTDYCSGHETGITTIGPSFDPYTSYAMQAFGLTPTHGYLSLPNATTGNSGVQMVTAGSNTATISEDQLGNAYFVCTTASCYENFETAANGGFNYYVGNVNVAYILPGGITAKSATYGTVTMGNAGVQILNAIGDNATVSEDTTGTLHAACYTANCYDSFEAGAGGGFSYYVNGVNVAFIVPGGISAKSTAGTVTMSIDSSGNAAISNSYSGGALSRAVAGAGSFTDYIGGVGNLTETSTALYPVATLNLGQSGQPFATAYVKNLYSAANPPTLSSCGTSPTVSSRSNSQGGYFVTGSGAPTACTVTFATAYPNAAYCTVTWASNGGAATYYMSAVANTGFTITLSGSGPGLAFTYTCAGN